MIPLYIVAIGYMCYLYHLNAFRDARNMSPSLHLQVSQLLTSWFMASRHPW